MNPPRFTVADERVAPWVAAVAALALYLALPSFRFNHDGVACAIAVELADTKHLLHGNHLLYGWIGMVFHGLVRALGLPLSALWSLQLMDSLLGALGTGLFCRLLLRLKFPVWMAWLAALGLATSYGWWLFSIDAQVYLLGAVPMILVWTEALSEKPRPYFLALFNSLAVLGHVLHVFFAPAAFYALWRSSSSPERLRADFMRYALGSTVLVTVAYALAAHYGVKPAGFEEFKLWMLGSAALGPGRTFLWYGPDSLGSGLLDWASSAGGVVSAVPALGAVLWLAAIAAFFSKDAAPRFAVRTVWIGILGYVPFLLSYEPYSIDYRVSDLAGIWLLAALWLRGKTPAPARPRAWAALLILIMAGANLAGGLRAHMLPENNRPYQKALWLKANLPENAWVAASGVDEVYIPYFAHLRTVNLRYFGAPGALRGRIHALARRGEPVFIDSKTVAQLGIEYFSGLGLQRAAAFEEYEIFLLRVPGN